MPRRSAPSFWARHKILINFWLDCILLVTFLALVWITVVIRFVFPSAESAAGYLLWNAPLGQWIEAQFVILAVFFAGIVLHLMLHWNWVCGVVGSHFLRRSDGAKRVFDDGQRTIAGVGLLILLLNLMGLGIAVASLSIQLPM